MPNFVSTEIIASFSFRGLCLSIIKPIAPYFRPSLSLGNISFTRLYSAESVLPGSFFIISDYGISPAYCLIIASSSSVQGDVFLFDMLKRQMIINIIRQGRGFSGGIRLCLAPAIQHLHGQGFDFGCISLYTFLVSPFSRFNWPFEVSKRTLFQVLLADLRQSPPGYYSMPLRFFLLFAVAVLVSFCCCHTHRGYCRIGFCIADFRFCTQPSNDICLVQ